MDVDIVVCTYNRATQLPRAIASIMEARCPAGVSLRVVLVNNNSSDATFSEMEKLSRTYPGRLVCLHESRQGKSHALNTALQNLTGGLIAFTDDDVSVDANWVTEMLAALERHPARNCFGGRTIAVYPDNLPGWLDLDGSMKFLRSVFVDRFDGDEEQPYGAGRTVSGTPAGVNMFFRHKALEQNGPFRTDLGPMGAQLGFSEDTEYCQRLMAAGEEFIYVPSAVVYHPVHENRLDKKFLLTWQYRCGRSEVRKTNGYPAEARLAGVPRYLFRKALKHGIGTVFSLSITQRFFNRLKLYYTSGEIVEHFVLGKR